MEPHFRLERASPCADARSATVRARVAAGAAWNHSSLAVVRRRRPRTPHIPRSGGAWFLFLPALAAIALYLLVYTETRYVAGFIVAIGVGLVASVRVPRTPDALRLVAAVAVLLMALPLVSYGIDALRTGASMLRRQRPKVYDEAHSS